MSITHSRKPAITAVRMRLLATIALALVAVASVAFAPASGLPLSPPSADAAAYTKAVYAPERLNSTQIRGWADLSRNCSGTLGCWNYLKIERSRWYGAQYVNGWWANNNGWNNITATLPYGCYDYRTTVDSYNDIAGSYGSGVNIGQVGVSSNGTKVYRYRTTWSSGWKRHCR